MVSWNGAMWREIHPFLDSHGQIKKGIGLNEKHLVIAVMEKQLWREKVLFKCMINNQEVSNLDYFATQSGIGSIEGLLDEPNWDDEPKLSAVSKLVNDGKCFWHEIRNSMRDVDDDPMSMLSGVCDQCDMNQRMDSSEFLNHKNCANCSANYTLRAFGSDDPSDINMRIYLAHEVQMEFINDSDWISCDVGKDLMGFIGITIRRLINSDIGKAISQYGFVRMHPSAAAQMFASDRAHLIVTTSFDRTRDARRFFRFSYDMGNKLYAAYVHACSLVDFFRCICHFCPDNFEGPEIINEMRRGLENSLLYFCSVGSVKMRSTNRKANKRSRGIKETIPSEIPGVIREINFHVPETETQHDFSPFSDILEDIESEEEDDQDEERKDGDEEEDDPMVISSEEGEMADEEEKEEMDDPMGVEEEEQPEAKRRRIAKMIRSINSTAEREEVSNAFDVILSRFKEPSSSPKVRKTSQKEESKKEAPAGSVSEKMTAFYPTELSMLDRCADLQGGHWTVHGTETKHVGPSSHYEVIDNLIPEMEEDIELERREVEEEGGPNEANSANTRFYVDIRAEFKYGRLKCPPLDGVRYCHPDFDDENFLASYRGHRSPDYPREGTPKYHLNKVLRHCIGRYERKYTGGIPLNVMKGHGC